MSEEQAAQMQEEANKIIESIESQKLDQSHSISFVYSLFIIVGISMIFENFVRSYKEEKRKKKELGEPLGDIRKKLLIVYGIHILVISLMWLICGLLLKITSPYIWFLTIVTVYIVEIGPMFTLHLKMKKEEKNDTAQWS